MGMSATRNLPTARTLCDRGEISTPQGTERGFAGSRSAESRDVLLDQQVIREVHFQNRTWTRKQGYQRAQAGLGQSEKFFVKLKCLGKFRHQRYQTAKRQWARCCDGRLFQTPSKVGGKSDPMREERQTLIQSAKHSHGSYSRSRTGGCPSAKRTSGASEQRCCGRQSTCFRPSPI